MSISIYKLIPGGETQVNKKSLQGAIKKHIGVISLAITAINAFIRGETLDPLVGENACQIRAAYYCAQAADPKVIKSLAEVTLKLEDLKGRISAVKLQGDKVNTSWDEIAKENGLDIEVPSVVAPIVHGYILTITKDSKLSIEKKELNLVEANDPKKLEGIGGARDVIKHARRQLSARSVCYLQEEAERLGIPGPEAILEDSMGLKTAPASPGMEILLTSMKVNGTIIALKNRLRDEEGQERGQVTLLYRPDGEKRCYQVIEDPQSVDRNCTAMVIEAVSISANPRSEEELKEEIVQLGIEPIIYANFAAHPQYGGMCKAIPPPPNEEREKWLKVALEKGLCAANPEVCRMYHIYAARIGGVL